MSSRLLDAVEAPAFLLLVFMVTMEWLEKSLLGANRGEMYSAGGIESWGVRIALL
jgi:hypothetical protein